MSPDNVHHVGVLTADLDAARLRWQAATGWTFSPVTRYRTASYRDLSDPQPHDHDARISFSFEGPPFIELMEQTGEGTHSARHGEGGHHLGFPAIPDNDVRTEELKGLGIVIDGENLQDGRTILMFTDRGSLNDVHAEYVEAGHDHPDVKDDGSPVNRLPDGEKTLFDLDTLARLRSAPVQAPLIGELGVVVADLEAAADLWSRVTGYTFAPGAPQGMGAPASVVSAGAAPRVRLVQSADHHDEGLAFLVLDGAGEMDQRSAAVRAAGVRVERSRNDESGRLTELWTRAEDLNGVQLRYLS